VPKVTLAKHDDVIECLPPDRANQAFGIGVLPGRSRCSWSVANAHRAKPSDECLAISAIAIANDIVRSGLPVASLRHLSSNPFSRRACRHPQPHDLSRRCRKISNPYSSRKESVGRRTSPWRRCRQLDCKERFGVIARDTERRCDCESPTPPDTVFTRPSSGRPFRGILEAQ
jgi:hypothetical protein